MGDVLSQNEIDALLNALSSGELDVDEIKESGEKQVKDYDFARPSKFSKEHLRTLEIIFEHYGRLLSTNLPVYLRKNVQIEVMPRDHRLRGYRRGVPRVQDGTGVHTGRERTLRSSPL